ncbi:MAG: Asp-tRNA(Asn)/Glu-tRNA(Gln) amidotransferase subunit GatC [Planctomycetota bacterium]|jgi:aspartyl-tRNA(Asn)/glutamyl-tRNA(Gln) amidotransferase subunit C
MSSSLDEAAVRHVAHLARLEISDEEVRRYADQLSAVLGYVDQLNELDTTDVPPTTHAVPLSNVFRDDAVRASLDAECALSNAPQQQDGFFRVPKVLDQEGA